MGIALDSCSRLMALLDRPAAGSTLAATAGGTLLLATGNDLSSAPAGVGAAAP